MIVNKTLNTVLISVLALLSNGLVLSQSDCDLTLPVTPELFQAQSINTDQINALDAQFEQHTSALEQQITCLENAQNALSPEEDSFEQIYFLYADIKEIAENSKLSVVNRYNFLLENKTQAEKNTASEN